MAVTVYPESCKVTLGEKAGAEEIGEYLAGIVEENRRPPIEVSRTAEDFRNGLYIQMVNADVNRELLRMPCIIRRRIWRPLPDAGQDRREGMSIPSL